jgi:hypothetical protein
MSSSGIEQEKSHAKVTRFSLFIMICLCRHIRISPGECYKAIVVNNNNISLCTFLIETISLLRTSIARLRVRTIYCGHLSCCFIIVHGSIAFHKW